MVKHHIAYWLFCQRMVDLAGDLRNSGQGIWACVRFISFVPTPPPPVVTDVRLPTRSPLSSDAASSSSPGSSATFLTKLLLFRFVPDPVLNLSPLVSWKLLENSSKDFLMSVSEWNFARRFLAPLPPRLERINLEELFSLSSADIIDPSPMLISSLSLAVSLSRLLLLCRRSPAVPIPISPQSSSTSCQKISIYYHCAITGNVVLVLIRSDYPP